MTIRNPFASLLRRAQFLRDAKEELEKVEWPSRKTAWRYTLIVLGTILVVGAFFTALDYGLTAAIKPFIE
jgi:preprotein translocase SecE subunit